MKIRRVKRRGMSSEELFGTVLCVVGSVVVTIFTVAMHLARY